MQAGRIQARVAARLARLGFADAERAAALLGPTGLGLWDEAANGPADPDAASVVSALARAGDPDLALLATVRLAEGLATGAVPARAGAARAVAVAGPTHRDGPGAAPAAAAARVAGPAGPVAPAVAGLADSPAVAGLLDRLRASGRLRARLIGLLGASAALGDHLAAHPADWRLLDSVDPAASAPEPVTRVLLAAVGADPDDPPTGTGGSAARGHGANVVAALQRAYRQRLLLLAAADLVGELTVDEVTFALADLAAATLSAALAVARAAVPAAAPCRLAIVGMGKCGGRELNYVSDVDVVFVAAPEAGGSPAGPAGNGAAVAEAAMLRSATALASHVIQVCGQVAWTVDTGLRPEGRDGPLVRTLASHLVYYQRWAHTWEFQALLKARPVAGDLALGQQYVAALAPLVWSASERDRFVEDVQAMRRRVEHTLPASLAARELKLGPGGLRDVEFAVQLLQLVHGRADESLRSGTTLAAMAELSGRGYVGRQDAQTLAASYRFLRTVEHRAQLQRLRRTHLVPDDDAGLRWLARALGYRPDGRGDAVAVFQAERALHTREVRRLHQKLFYRPLLSAVARVPSDQLRLTPQAARQRLVALGYTDPDGALRHLESLTGGVSRRAAIQRALLPVMLESFADAPDPDAGLLAYRQVSDAIGETPWYLRLLRDSGQVADRLALVLGSSRYAGELLVRAPEGLQLLAEDEQLRPRPVGLLQSSMRGVVGRHDEPGNAVVAARGLRRQELLRTAFADVLGLLDEAEVGVALSDVADATVEAALDVAIRAVTGGGGGGPLPTRLAVIAMGRLGGAEIGYGSDADVLFVHKPAPGASERDASQAAHAVAEELRRLLALPAPDPPLLIDANLRPEGRNGPLVRSLASYAAYYARWSSPWEAQALLRAVPVAGDPGVGAEFVTLVDRVRYPPGGLDHAAVTEIRRLKARIDAERLPRGADPATHTKLGRGGLADVEWTVQLLQLRHGAEIPTLQTPRTLAAVAAARDADLLAPDDAAALEAAWRMATRARNAMMLVRGRPADQLPWQGRELVGVARCMGYPPGCDPGQFLDDYRRTTRRARRVVERVFYG